MSGLPEPAARVSALAVRAGRATPLTRAVPEETPVAFSFDFTGFGVMMATPSDLEDFAIGFALSEGIVAHADEIAALEIAPLGDGIECRMMLKSGLPEAVRNRHRFGAGPVGCGLCGIAQLDEALRPLPKVASPYTLSATALSAMVAALNDYQPLNRETRAVHAAAFFRDPAAPLVVREDVGRHNALDKLAGALARAGESAENGVVVMSSRLSIELVQKAARMGVPVLAAISVPSALAIRAAEAADITLIAIARADGFEVFTHPHRILYEVASHVA